MALRRWSRPARRAGVVPRPGGPRLPDDRGPEQAWRSAPPVRRSLSEPVSPVLRPGFTGRLATYQLATMTIATRPASTWTSLTPLTRPAWTRRRGGAGTARDLAAAGLAADHAPSWWPSAPRSGTDSLTAGLLTPGSPLTTAARLSPDAYALAHATRSSRSSAGQPAPVFRQSAPVPASAKPGPVEALGPVERNRAAVPAGRPGHPRAGLGQALPGLPGSARSLDPDLTERTLPLTPPGTVSPAAFAAPAPPQAGPHPGAGIGPVLGRLPSTARPLRSSGERRPSLCSGPSRCCPSRQPRLGVRREPSGQTTGCQSSTLIRCRPARCRPARCQAARCQEARCQEARCPRAMSRSSSRDAASPQPGTVVRRTPPRLPARSRSTAQTSSPRRWPRRWLRRWPGCCGRRRTGAGNATSRLGSCPDDREECSPWLSLSSRPA